MKRFSNGAALALLGIAVTCIGCAQDVDQDDVTAARENVNEEIQETQQARNEASENINEERRETDATRHEVLKPDYDEIREEGRETNEARQEGNEEVREEEKETRKAEENLAETEAKLAAQKDRDSFLANPQALLKTASTRIDQLEKTADTQEGEVKEATDKQIDELQEAHDNLEEAIDDVKSADPLKWKAERLEVETAQRKLQEELDDAK